MWNKFVWENFESTVFSPFIHDFTFKGKKAFTNIQFWIPLLIFDPRKLPLTKDELTRYGTCELEAILNYYGQAQSKTFEGNFVQQERDVNSKRANTECDMLKKKF